MWGEIIILLLWAADKNLLSRLWAFCSATLNRTAWSAVALYSNWKSNKLSLSLAQKLLTFNSNEMIRDGYHVDEVFLYESVGTATRAIDVLRIFRQHIQSQTFTHTKRISLKKFISLCCEQDSNFTEINNAASYDLVVSYTFDHKRYTVVYSDHTAAGECQIRFPIYSEKTIRDRDLKHHGSITAAMLTATEDAEDGIDIYQQLTQLAGPLGNFYSDTEYSVQKSHLHYTGVRVAMSNMFIKVLDLWGNEFVIKPEQTTIKLTKE